MVKRALSDPNSSALSDKSSALDAHKGKLALGVAATLGMLIFYKWRERMLAKEDPEGYARLQRLKASVRHGNHARKSSDAAKQEVPHR